MSDTPQVINTLTTKAEELTAYIRKLEKAIGQARSDLAHVNASIRLFTAPPPGTIAPVRMNIGLLLKSKELGRLCREALTSGPQNTRELALYIIRDKGLDEADKHLYAAVALRVVNAMRMAEKRGKVQRIGKKAQTIVWAIKQPAANNLPNCG